MGNFSRYTFDKLKHYVGVRLQQGVPLVDADWNEQEEIRKYELQAFLKWFVGNGVPEGNDGFRIVSIVNKIILTSKKTDIGESSVSVRVILDDFTKAAEALGFGPGNNFASRAAPPAAQLTGEVAETFVLADDMTLVISADDLPEETVTFHESNFTDISAATAAEVVAAINSAMNNLTASAGTSNDFDIKGGDGTAEGAGRCLVEGWDAINESNLKYSAQPLFENGTLAEKWGVKPVNKLEPPAEIEGERTDTVYLDVWEREVDADEDGNLVNSAIGIETCVRLKREWVVRVAQGTSETEFDAPPEGHVYYPLAMLTRESGKDRIEADDITDLRFTDVHLASAPSTTGVVVFPKFINFVQNISDLIDPELGPGAISVRLGLDHSTNKDIFVGHSQASDIFGLDRVLLGALIEPQSGKFRVGIKVQNPDTASIRVRWWAFKPRQDIGEVIVPAEIHVIIDPETANLDQGENQLFSAKVSGTTNTAVTWRVEEGAAGGRVNDKGLYTAPNKGGTFHVRVTSEEDTSKYARARIKVGVVICVRGGPGAIEPCTGSGPYLPCVVGQPS
jgi:hypothetical protein